MKSVAGTRAVLARLASVQDQIVGKVAEATEMTAVEVGVAAAKGHKPGFGHTVGRYENVTTTLTRSLLQAPVADKVDEEEVIYSLGSNLDYAYPVEVRYPYLWPAAVSKQGKFRKNVTEALR